MMLVMPRRRASAGPSLWTPTNLGAAGLAWYDANDASSYTASGGLISAWEDKIGSNDLAQATDGNKLQTGGDFNGVSCIQSDASDRWMEATAFGSGTYSIFAIFRHSGANTSSTIIADNDTFILLAASGSGATNWYRINNVNNPSVTGLIVRTNGAASSIDGVAGTRGEAFTLVSNATACLLSLVNCPVLTSGVRIGGGAPSTAFNLHGELGDVIFVDGSASSTDRDKCEGYLAHKYNAESVLDAGHTYKSSPPTV
jgi:hypothetical protein